MSIATKRSQDTRSISKPPIAVTQTTPSHPPSSPHHPSQISPSPHPGPLPQTAPPPQTRTHSSPYSRSPSVATPPATGKSLDWKQRAWLSRARARASRRRRTGLSRSGLGGGLGGGALLGGGRGLKGDELLRWDLVVVIVWCSRPTGRGMRWREQSQAQRRRRVSWVTRQPQYSPLVPLPLPASPPCPHPPRWHWRPVPRSPAQGYQQKGPRGRP